MMVEYNQSIYYDRAFYAQDIAGSIAWARANHKTGILSADEFSTIEKGLKQVGEEWESDCFDIKPGIDEDIHTAIERRLCEIGMVPSASSLHWYLNSDSRHKNWRKATHRYEGRNFWVWIALIRSRTKQE